LQTQRLPTLFVSHGAPLFALAPGASGAALSGFAKEVQTQHTLRGVVIMSPHWMSRTPAVMTTPKPETLHDFGGFPPALYALQYPAPGAPVLAQQAIGLLEAAGFQTQADAKRPLDHGAWVPLMHMFPQADVPVIQVTLPQSYGPQQVFAMGQALSGLRSLGILLIGSGSMTHNLSEFAGDGAPTAPYVLEFSRWIEDRVVASDWESLLNYASLAPHAHRAHPSDDHFLPLFFALGAAGASSEVQAHYLSREVLYGMLAMDSFYLQ
jgi:4,5-DOPA dioxygenase extradiol